MSRMLALIWLAGCSFSPGVAQPANPDGSAGGSGHADASSSDAARADTMTVSGAISISVTTLDAVDIDLTTEGTTDWAHWGLGGTTHFDHMNGGTSISNLAATPAVSFTGAPVTASWTNGTPQSTASMTNTGVGDHAGGNMQLTAPAGVVSHVLRVYAGVQLASAILNVSLSDNSAAPQSMTLVDNNGTMNVQYTITYNAATAGQTLKIGWTDTNDFGNASQSFNALLSATLK